MTSIRTLTAIAAVVTAMAGPAYAADTDSHEAHHPASSAKQQIAQTEQPARGMGMGPGMGPGMSEDGRMAPSGFAEQMQAMHAMHETMVAAKTPEERSELMTEHMKLMQNGMAMMGRMGGGMGMGGGAMMGSARPGAAPVQPDGLAGRQHMLEQRMDMMQSAMQMMMGNGRPCATSAQPDDLTGRQHMMEQRMDMMQSMMQMMMDRMAPPPEMK